jgi:hypothetical protein
MWSSVPDVEVVLPAQRVLFAYALRMGEAAYNGIVHAGKLLLSPEVPMSRISLVIPILLVVPLATAKNKKPVLPADVLKAQTVLVMIKPDAGEPLTDISANRTAREAVERSLMKWGRFRLALDSETADLIFAVRTGNGQTVRPTIGNSPMDNPPVIFQPGTTDTRGGVQSGRPPGMNQPTGVPDSPRPGTEIGPSEDTLEVYRGSFDHPLDNPPVWRFSGKDGLRAPSVLAVEQFHKAIDESEKALAQKQSKAKP